MIKGNGWPREKNRVLWHRSHFDEAPFGIKCS